MLLLAPKLVLVFSSQLVLVLVLAAQLLTNASVTLFLRKSSTTEDSRTFSKSNSNYVLVQMCVFFHDKVDKPAPCSSHCQIVIWICFWYYLSKSQLKRGQIGRRQCCLLIRSSFAAGRAQIKSIPIQYMTPITLTSMIVTEHMKRWQLCRWLLGWQWWW